MPTVKKKPARKKPAARRKPARRVSRSQKQGLLERFGQQADKAVGIVASGAFQFAVLAMLAGGLLLFILSLFSTNLAEIPGRIAAAPEAMARGLGMNVMRVTIKGGDELSTREIMNALRDERHGSIIGRPLLTVNAGKLRDQVAELGPVRDVAVSKLLPNTIHISVTTRHARALYQDAEGTFFLIDGDGSVIKTAEPTENTELPVVSGTTDPRDASAFLAALRAHPVLFARTAGVEVVGGRRIDLRFRNGFLAKLPEEGIDAALARLSSLDAGTGSLAANLDYLDLRDPDWAYYKPKDE